MSEPARHLSEWTRSELAFIDSHEDLSVTDLAAILDGHSERAIQRARSRIFSSLNDDPWSQEEDETIRSTPHLTATQVGRLLDRSVASVNSRRKLIGETYGIRFGDGSNKSPFQIGARPLIAKSCTKCGLLLPSEWFSFSPRQNGTGGWKSSCRKCQANYQANDAPSRFDKERDVERHAESTRASRKRLQQLTTPRAHRKGLPWTDDDHEVLRDPDLTLVEKALRLGRSYNAVSIVCSSHGYRSHVGLGEAEKDLWVIANPNAPLSPAA